MKAMKGLLLLFSVSAALLPGAGLSDVHSVYMLPMARGMDQYLAHRLTNQHVFEVVTDPKMATAVFTDQIGAAFEQRLAELTTPEPVAARPADDNSGEASGAPMNRLTQPISTISGARARGMVFLVDVKTHQVLWSAFEVPKTSEAEQMNRAASDIVSRLKKTLGKK